MLNAWIIAVSLTYLAMVPNLLRLRARKGSPSYAQIKRGKIPGIVAGTVMVVFSIVIVFGLPIAGAVIVAWFLCCFAVLLMAAQSSNDQDAYWKDVYDKHFNLEGRPLCGWNLVDGEMVFWEGTHDFPSWTFWFLGFGYCYFISGIKYRDFEVSSEDQTVSGEIEFRTTEVTDLDTVIAEANRISKEFKRQLQSWLGRRLDEKNIARRVSEFSIESSIKFSVRSAELRYGKKVNLLELAA